MRRLYTPALLTALCALSAGPLSANAQPDGKPAGSAPVRTTPFPDVPRDHWAYDAVEQLRKRGILRGYPPSPKPAARPRSAAGRRSG
jgi:hypothetical protein